MCWSTETSPLLRRSTWCPMRPRMSATLDTRCAAHPNVFAYQTASGVDPLQSVAETVSPEQQPYFSLLLLSPIGLRRILIHDRFNTLFFLLPQQDLLVLILVSQLVPQEQGTSLKLTTQWNTPAMATCSWWGRVKECVGRTATGPALSQHASVRVISKDNHHTVTNFFQNCIIVHFCWDPNGTLLNIFTSKSSTCYKTHSPVTKVTSYMQQFSKMSLNDRC